MADVLAFAETGLELELIEKVVPQIVLREHTSVAKDYQAEFCTG